MTPIRGSRFFSLVAFSQRYSRFIHANQVIVCMNTVCTSSHQAILRNVTCNGWGHHKCSNRRLQSPSIAVDEGGMPNIVFSNEIYHTVELVRCHDRVCFDFSIITVYNKVRSRKDCDWFHNGQLKAERLVDHCWYSLCRRHQPILQR